MPGMASPRVSFNAESHLQVRGSPATNSPSIMRMSCTTYSLCLLQSLQGSSILSSCFSVNTGSSRLYGNASHCLCCSSELAYVSGSKRYQQQLNVCESP